MRLIDRCPICGKHERVLVYEGTLDTTNTARSRVDPYGAHYQINRCAGCGLVFSSPIFDDVDIAALYEQAPQTNVMIGEEGNVRRTMQLYYDLARPYLRGRDRILDIGCDIGLMLDFAYQDRFRELHGLEPNPVARRQAMMIPGAIISDKFYEEQDYPEATFDLITFIHVIDHLVDPTKVIEGAFRHLKPGGVVIAAVHNVESLLAKVMGERFPPYNLYHHYFFSKTTLRRLFESRGFEALQVSSTPNCYSLGFFVRKAPGVPERLRSGMAKALNAMQIGKIPVTIPVGNIGIVARRPLAS